MNKNKFNMVKFCNEKQFNQAKNSYFFNDAKYYDGKFSSKRVDEKPDMDHFKEDVDDEEDEKVHLH